MSLEFAPSFLSCISEKDREGYMILEPDGIRHKAVAFPAKSTYSGITRRISQILVGHTCLKAVSWLFDNPLYLFMIYRFGPAKGGLIMTTLSMLVCLGLLLVYERMKVDWLGVSVLEEVKERGEPWVKRLYTSLQPGNPWRRTLVVVVRILAFIPAKIFLAVLWALKKGDGFAFVALSFYEDPFVTTAFLRHGRFDGLCRRDWLVFTGSVVVSNGFWILRSFAVVEVTRAVWRALSA